MSHHHRCSCISTTKPADINSFSSYCSQSSECLQFDLVCRTVAYEVRHYTPSRWVSTDAEAYFMGVGAAMAFRRLYQYISGANQEGIQIDMATPVLVRVPEHTPLWEPAIYTLNFLLPSAYQENPPIPTNDKLYFTDMPEVDVYVRGYGGWMLSVTSRLHSHLLTEELQRVNAHYNHTHHYAVGYDSPLKLLNRHNEVWYVVENEPVCDGVNHSLPQDLHPHSSTSTGTTTTSTGTTTTSTGTTTTSTGYTTTTSTGTTTTSTGYTTTTSGAPATLA
ncbi:heme-binding protein 2 isoform X2 [Brachyhypopomus gauderio]|uniref:heme-binding protein 2 isoform X2 n=1 Tax=Brachyhypopomus gauderio TaxID=698409 RepID=UPI004041B0ED